MNELLDKLQKQKQEDDAIQNLLGRVSSPQAKDAINTAIEIADLVNFHAMVRKNVKEMSQLWEM